MKVSSPCKTIGRTISLFSSPHLIDGWMNGWMNGLDEWVEECVEEWVDEWVDEWMIYLSTSDSRKP
jgi:hypothetical protein